MLNAKALIDLLSQNRDDRLCKRWCLMTPNGTLLAYSQPTDINDLRKHAAIAAISWQEHQNQHEHVPLQDRNDFPGDFREDQAFNPLHVLVIQDETSNIIMRQIQRQLLLVLEGGVPPRRAGFVKAVTAEGRDGSLLTRPHKDDDSSRPATSSSEANGGNNVAGNVLKLQRKKMEALAAAIIADFEQTGFRMPDEGGSTVF